MSASKGVRRMNGYSNQTIKKKKRKKRMDIPDFVILDFEYFTKKQVENGI